MGIMKIVVPIHSGLGGLNEYLQQCLALSTNSRNMSSTSSVSLES